MISWKDRRTEARSRGMCGHCLTKPATGGLSECQPCRNNPKRKAGVARRDEARRLAKLASHRDCRFGGCPRPRGISTEYCSRHEQQRRRGRPLTNLPLSSHHRPAWTQQQRGELVRMYHGGKTMPEIATALGYPLSTIKGRVAKYCAQLRASRQAESTVSRPLTPYPGVQRCRCGLALPCLSCIPSIYEFAGSRVGDSAGVSR